MKNVLYTWSVGFGFLVVAVCSGILLFWAVALLYAFPAAVFGALFLIFAPYVIGA